MLNEIFMSVPDHRVTGRCSYLLPDLLTIALLTYVCGGEDYVDMSEFAHIRARDFGLLSYTDKSPSPDTFERLMSAVDPDEMNGALSITDVGSLIPLPKSRWSSTVKSYGIPRRD